MKVLSAIILVLCLMASVLSGCQEPASPTSPDTAAPVTAPETAALPTVDELLAKVSQAHSESLSFKGDGEMSMVMVVSDGTDKQEIAADTTYYCEMDTENQGVMFEMQIQMNDPASGEPINMQSLIYLQDNTMYMRMAVPDMETQWLKQELDVAGQEEAWAGISDQVSQETTLKLLEACNFSDVAVGKLDGTDCYILEANPDIDQILDLLMELYQGAGTGDLPLDVGEMFKNVNVKYWISTDDFLMAQAQVKMDLDFSQEDFNITGAFDVLQRYYDYGSTISFTIPEEALNATGIN